MSLYRRKVRNYNTEVLTKTLWMLIDAMANKRDNDHVYVSNCLAALQPLRILTPYENLSWLFVLCEETQVIEVLLHAHNENRNIKYITITALAVTWVRALSTQEEVTNSRCFLIGWLELRSGLLSKAMLKSILVNEEFLKWLLIGWRCSVSQSDVKVRNIC